MLTSPVVTGEKRTRASMASRSFAVVLLAVHLVLFALGGAFLDASTARASNHRVVVTATTGGSDGSALISQTDPRFELGTRPRGDRGDGMSGGPQLHFVIPRGLAAGGPAAFSGTLDWRSATRERRSEPSIVYGARGPPASR